MPSSRRSSCDLLFEAVLDRPAHVVVAVVQPLAVLGEGLAPRGPPSPPLVGKPAQRVDPVRRHRVLGREEGPEEQGVGARDLEDGARERPDVRRRA